MKKYLVYVISGGETVLRDEIEATALYTTNGMYSFYGPGKMGANANDGGVIVMYPIGMTVVKIV